MNRSSPRSRRVFNSRRNFRNGKLRSGSFFAPYPTKFDVINQLRHRWMLAAHRAVRILPQFEFAEAHREGIKEKQAPDERLSLANDELQGFGGLNGSNNSGQNSQHAAFGARWHQSRGRRLGIQAAITRPVGITEDGYLSFEPED